jgi:hypothetical protein
MEAAEVAGGDSAATDQRRKLELHPAGEGKRALGSNQKVGQIELVAAGGERVEVVAADPTLNLGKMGIDLVRLRSRQADKIARDLGDRGILRQIRQIGRRPPEMGAAAVRQDGVNRDDVLAGIAVPERPRPTMPPMVARDEVEISTGNQSPCGLSARLSSSSTMPGSTTQRLPAASSSRMR